MNVKLFSSGLKGKIVFVGGIDTGIGKSYATGHLAARLMQQGLRVITFKPVQTGCNGFSDDLALHRRIQGIAPLPEDLAGETCPYLFPYPCSPHLAARMAGEHIDSGLIARHAEALAARYDLVLVEGAGGLAVPLNGQDTTLDLLEREGWPLVLVTSGRLGSINHTLLSLEACQTRNIPVAMLIYNRFPASDPLIEADTAAYLQQRLRQDFPQVVFEEMGEIPLG